MALPRSAPSARRILLVEGQNDKHVVRHLCKRHQTTPDFDILDRGGLEPLLETVGAELNVLGRKAVGILVDANDDLAARWKSVTDRLLNEGVTAPRQPTPKGTVIDTIEKPRVGIWIMPDNTSTGELEDFVMQMIPEGDPVWPLATRYIGEIPKADRKFQENKTRRAELYSWLAARENPKQMGSAIGSYDLNVDGIRCKNFLDWLKILFA